MAIYNWREKFTTGSFSFNKIEPLVFGPSAVAAGKEVTIEVLMIAHDTHNQPRLTTNLPNTSVVYPGNGTARVTFTPTVGLNRINGTVSIKNKSGVEQKRKWSYQIEGSQ